MLVSTERSEARIVPWLAPGHASFRPSGREHCSARRPDEKTMAAVRAKL